MKVLYLFGNGFDLSMGLKTRYTDFYDYYLTRKSTNNYIMDFKEELSKNKKLENWSDLELILGKYASHFGDRKLFDIYMPDEAYISLLDDIQDNLAIYIQQQDSDFTITDNDRKKIYRDLVFFDSYLSPRDQSLLEDFKKQVAQSPFMIRAMIFNYTQSFEKMIGWKGVPIRFRERKTSNGFYEDVIKNVEHIHGTTTEDMIIGVNDPDQIDNPYLRNSAKTIRAIVKPEMNINAGTMRDERCKQYIGESDVICIYGMSLGATDKYWWNLIVDRLASSNARLVVFSYSKDINAIRGYRSRDQKDALIDKLLSYSNLDDEIKAKIAERIFVCFNSSIFKANIERHLPNEKDNEFMINVSKQASKIAKASEAMEKYYDLTK